MKKYLLPIMIFAMFLSLPVHAKTVCYSKLDTNEIEYCGFDFMSLQDLEKAYKKHQIWTPDVRIDQKGKKLKVSFGSVPGSNGYELRYSKKLRNKKLVKPQKFKTCKRINRISLKSKKIAYVQIRPYKKIKKKTVYGRWSSIYAYSNK